MNCRTYLNPINYMLNSLSGLYTLHLSVFRYSLFNNIYKLISTYVCQIDMNSVEHAH